MHALTRATAMECAKMENVSATKDGKVLTAVNMIVSMNVPTEAHVSTVFVSASLASPVNHAKKPRAQMNAATTEFARICDVPALKDTPDTTVRS